MRSAALGLLVASVLGAALLPAAGCARHERSRTSLPDSTYVTVMARLSLLTLEARGRRPPLPDSVLRNARAAILRGHGVGRRELLAFARAAGDEPERMERLWSEIGTRVDSLRNAGWTPPGVPPDSASPGER